MAALLVGSCTRPGDTIVSVGDVPALAGAAGAGGRTYLPVPDPDGLTRLDHAAGIVALVVLPWPPPDRSEGMSRGHLVAMLRACRRLMTNHGCTIVAVAAARQEATLRAHLATRTSPMPASRSVHPRARWTPPPRPAASCWRAWSTTGSSKLSSESAS